jgi:hypothetical protein
MIGVLRGRMTSRVLEYKAHIEAAAAPSYETRRSRRLLDAARRDAQTKAERD